MKKYIFLSIASIFIHIAYCENSPSKLTEGYLYKGHLHQKSDHPDSARYFYKKTIDTDESIYSKADAYLHLSEIEESSGNYKEALHLLHMNQNWQDSIQKAAHTEIVQQMHTMHNNHSIEKKSMKRSIALYRSELIAIGLLLLVAAYFLYKKHRKHGQPERKEMFLRKSDIYARFHSINQESHSIITEDEWTELQKAIDETYENFTGTLYTLCQKLSPMELRICYLMKISISVTNIAYIVGRSKSAVSTTRSKLYEKLKGKKGTPEMLDNFIAEL
ncbi:helix-turn-helix transcriptional regulator [Bacteroides sp.]